jgi:hypothetical protein
MLAVSFAMLSGCDRQSERVFDETSSARVQALIDLTYSTLTSSEEGWFLEYFPGWDGEYQNGGYWFWLKFDTLDPATGESLVTVASELVKDGTTYTTATSPYEIIRGHGAVLTFRIYNEVMDIFCLPTEAELQGKQGDLEFRIVDVTNDIVTVVGTRTGMTMRFLRKTADRTYTEDFDNSSGLGDILNVTTDYEVGIKGITGATVSRNDRKFEVKYKEIIDGEEEDITKLFTLFPSRTDESFTLRAPVEIAGATITGFTFAYDGTAPTGEDIGVYTSTDAAQTVKFIQAFPPMNISFLRKIQTFTYDFITEPGKTCTEVLEMLATANAGLGAEGETLYRAGFGMGIHSSYRNTSMSFACLPIGGSSYYVATYEVEFKAVEDTLDEITMEYLRNLGDGGYPLYESLFLDPVVRPICDHSPYVLTLNGDELTLTSKADPSFFFTAW